LYNGEKDIIIESANLGGASIGCNLFRFLDAALPRGSWLLELGAGYGTIELNKLFQVISVEHDDRFIGLCNSHYMKVFWSGSGFYDRDVLESVLKEIKYDGLLIDGPPGPENRSCIVNYLDLFDLNG
jgi:hypothetical protein